MLSKFLYLLGGIAVLASAADLAPTVVIGAGTVIGTATVLPSSTVTVNKFLGIPYAVTPPKRFLPPEPIKSYPGPINATAFSHICMQQNASETADLIATESEDCLYLNIFTPASCDCGKAVMFSIHGGGLEEGSGIGDGSSIVANQDVIVVAINYRLNAFGFSNAPYLSITSQNAGFWDQRMALSWVQDNIAAFGGDPTKVTVFGQSSGASSIDRLLTTMLDNPPFRAAILQSGQATLSAFPNDGGPESWAKLVSALNCTDANSNATLEFACVQEADAFAVREIVNQDNLDFSPVNDNVTQQATPFLAARQAGSVAQVPLLTGTNGQEGMILATEYSITNFSQVTDEQVEAFVTAISGSPDTYSQLQPLLTEIQASFPWYDLFQVAAQMYTEIVFQCPCKLVTEASYQGNLSTWRYFYNATIPNAQPEGYPTLGAYHTSEIAMIWELYSDVNATDQEIALSAFMQKAWADFAKDPVKGPGWKPLDGTGNSLACLGCNGSSGVQIIPENQVDTRCSQYAPLFTATTPLF